VTSRVASEVTGGAGGGASPATAAGTSTGAGVLPWPDLLALATLNLLVGLSLPAARDVVASAPAVETVLQLAGRPVLGFYVLFALPCRALAAKTGWGTRVPAERLVYSVASVVLAVMVAGLGANALLPALGVDRPLDPVPSLVLLDLMTLGLLAWRPHRQAGRRTRRSGSPRTGSLGSRPLGSGLVLTWPGADVGVLVLAVGSLSLAVVGAIRLNNGADGSLTLLSLAVGAVAWLVLLARRRRLRPGTIHAAVYLLGLALLLMTSLRGWGITGHDIQRELRVFEAVRLAGHWDIATFRDPYNACLSITVLPTVVAAITGVGPVQVLKILPQLLFALGPVIVYLTARRFTGRGISLLAALIFVAFPTYFGDMPFLTRQEIAFLFLGAGFLAATDAGISVTRRRILFGVLGVGVVLSHYSTTYVLIAVLLVALATRRLWWLADRWLPGRSRRDLPPGRLAGPVIGLANVALLIGLTFAWSQLVTQTNGQLSSTLREAVTELRAPGSADNRSSDTRYNLIGGTSVTPEQRLADYRRLTLAATAAGRSRGEYLPAAVVAEASTPAAPDPDLPVTAAGRTLERAGLDVSGANHLVRQGTARLLQVFFVLGVVGCLVAGRRRLRADLDLLALAGASFVAVLSQVVLPQVSVDYGVLRAFQQALFLLAPFLAYGMVVSMGLLRRRATAGAAGLGMTCYLSLTGALPQATGGYPAQLHLNNSGRYYDVYYLHAGETQGMTWLTQQVTAVGGDTRREIQTDRYTLSRVRSRVDPQASDDIYPTLLRADAYIFLGYATTRKGEATFSYLGDLVTYHYPLSVLRHSKDLIYSNGSSEIYR
jgi:uncharacterized membrane protein